MEAGGYRFHFLYDRRQPHRLHIELRPGIEIQTAVDTFFSGWHAWNEVRARFECYSRDTGLYWTWLYGDEASADVLVISLFQLEED